ncbi:MAG: hypothetical protein KGM96_15070 [Acidobacteriota bacterium]|nr:hypothetical protein [Acidobacteriota bacterium]
MTRRFQSITHMLLIALVAGLICSAAAASAQNSARVYIPFAFTANHQAMPAGYYQVQLLSDSFLALADRASGRIKTTLMVHTADAYNRISRSSLVFHVSGTRYVLTDVRFAGTNMESQLAVQPKPERELTKNSQPSASTIEVAMK